MNKYYIAYGSNLNVNQMKRRCPESKIIGKGFINNYELLFKGSFTGAYLTIEKKKGGKVPIAIWQVSKQDELNLDIYEGYPKFYYKKNFEIKNNDKKTKAFAYIMHEERKINIPSEYYINTCIDGYKFFDFDIKFLKNAIKKSYDFIKKS